MVFSAAIYSNTTTGVLPREEKPKAEEVPKVDKTPLPAVAEAANDKHDPWEYTLRNAAFIALAGVAAGAQEAFYKFEKMTPAQSRLTGRQALTILSAIGRKTVYAGALGAVFCGTETYLESVRGTHDMTNGMLAGAATGLVFGLLPPKPMPQPFAWPFAFAAIAASADLVGEKIPAAMQTFRSYGPLEHRPNWGDPAPPRPPVLETGASMRPVNGGHFWRGP